MLHFEKLIQQTLSEYAAILTSLKYETAIQARFFGNNLRNYDSVLSSP